VPLVFRVTNTAAESVTLQLLGRTPNADFRISNADGETIWTRLRGQTLLGALRLHPLGPGEELVFQAVWNGRADTGRPAPHGDYLIRGVLMTDAPNGLASSPSPLRIER
jgi:hypothetical protein